MLVLLLIMMTVNADFKGNLLSLLQCIHGSGLVFSRGSVPWLFVAEGSGGQFGHGAWDQGTACSRVPSPALHCVPWPRHSMCWPACIYVLLGTAALEQPCAGQESEMRVQTIAPVIRASQAPEYLHDRPLKLLQSSVLCCGFAPCRSAWHIAGFQPQ